MGAGLQRLARMAGLRAVKRALRIEDDAAERNMKAQERELEEVGENSTVAADAEDADMDLMAARDIHWHERPERPERPEPVRPGMNAAGKAAVVAAALMGGGIIGAAAMHFLRPPVEKSPSESASGLILDLGPPAPLTE